RRRTVVRRARMRALSLGYLAIVALLLAAVLTASLAAKPAIQIGFALATIAIVPLLYAGFVPPTWLRRTWRQSEEDKFQQATRDIVMFASDPAALATRSLDRAIRLTGADAGLFMSGARTAGGGARADQQPAGGQGPRSDPANSAARGGEPRARCLLLHHLARPARAVARRQRFYRHSV